MNAKYMILPRSGFQTSVNLAYDLDDSEKVRDFIPTEATMRVLEKLVLATAPGATERAHILIGAYGKGKSHAVLILLSLLAKRHPGAMGPTITALSSYRPELGAYVKNQVLAEDVSPLLPVIVDGAQKDLTRAFLLALRHTLQAAHLSDLLPETPYEAAVKQIRRWKKEFPATYDALSKQIDVPMKTFLARLASFDGTSYRAFLAAYPKLTAGSTFDPFADADVVELYAAAARAVKARGYRGLYVVYDEFGKYLESQIETAGVSETRLLQDFAERAGRSGASQLHLLLITHKDFANYIGRLPKWKVDGWRGVSERFVHVEMPESIAEAYDLIGQVIEKDPVRFPAFEKSHAKDFLALATHAKRLGILADANDLATAVRDAYPLHPLTLALLPRLSALVAQNERTLFTFLARDSCSTLMDFLRQAEARNEEFPLLRPDVLFDYFEPSFRQEPYTSPLGAIYRRGVQALHRTEEALSCKLLKTVALLEMTAQGSELLPTSDVLVFACAGEPRPVLHALHELIDEAFLLHENPRTGVLTIKDASGIDVRRKCHDRAQRIQAERPFLDVLNQIASNIYLYPAQYNDELEMTRYFTVRFLTGNAFFAQKNFETEVDKSGADGIVYALVLSSNEERTELAKRLALPTLQAKRCLFILPDAWEDVAGAAYSSLAADMLEKEAGEDSALAEEYRLIQKDAQAVLQSFLERYLEPERGGMSYYYAGDRKKIHRRAQLSQMLSSICADVYSETPIINNETLNRNVLTTASLRTRERVMEALLEPELSYNLGQTGVSQGIAFVRSALLHTGILTQENGVSKLHLSGLADEKINHVMEIIGAFFAHANGSETSSFGWLYERLRSPAEHIAMKRGPIPVLLAAALHFYRDYMTITGPEGREMEMTADLFRAIEAHPDVYYAYREDWNPEKQAYLDQLEQIFSTTLPDHHVHGDFASLGKAMQRWYLSLPNFARQTKHLSAQGLVFRKSLQRPYLNAREYLFEILPKRLASSNLGDAVRAVAAAKTELDGVKADLVQRLERRLVDLFGRDVKQETSLRSALADWRERLSYSTRQHIFQGETQAMFTLVLTPPKAEAEMVEALAHAVLGLRIDDWDDAKESVFLAAVERGKADVDIYEENAQKDHEEKPDAKSQVKTDFLRSVREDYSLIFVNEEGERQQRSFDHVAVSPRAALLRNEIDDALETMGGSLSREEKRQVLVEVLQALL